jgi:hypothetical protein
VIANAPISVVAGHGHRDQLDARVVNYADDFVICHPRCESAPNWDPSVKVDYHIDIYELFSFGWGPDRRRSGPHPERVLI